MIILDMTFFPRRPTDKASKWNENIIQQNVLALFGHIIQVEPSDLPKQRPGW